MAHQMMMIPAAEQGIKYRLKHFVFLMEHFHLPAPSVYSSSSYTTLFSSSLIFFSDREIICIICLSWKKKSLYSILYVCVYVCVSVHVAQSCSIQWRKLPNHMPALRARTIEWEITENYMGCSKINLCLRPNGKKRIQKQRNLNNSWDTMGICWRKHILDRQHN